MTLVAIVILITTYNNNDNGNKNHGATVIWTPLFNAWPLSGAHPLAVLLFCLELVMTIHEDVYKVG